MSCLAAVVCAWLGGCRSTAPRPAPVDAPALRFLLTFDDGPSIRATPNPTEQVLDTLARNPLQPGIKAVFFVQTRAVNGGGTPLGRQLIRRELAQGHVLGFHTATPGHSNHLGMRTETLRASLQLAEAGMKVALLESRMIGWGASGRNGGQMIPGLRWGALELEREFGSERAKRLLEVTNSAAGLVKGRIERHATLFG